MSRRRLASIMDIKSATFIPLKSNVLLSSACVGASSIIKSPSGCRLKRNLLSANEIDTSPVQGHCSWFAPAWKWAPRYFMGQCSAHNIASKASRCHCNWITFPFILSLNAPLYSAVIYKTETWENVTDAGHTLEYLHFEFVVVLTSFGIVRGLSVVSPAFLANFLIQT